MADACKTECQALGVWSINTIDQGVTITLNLFPLERPRKPALFAICILPCGGHEISGRCTNGDGATGTQSIMMMTLATNTSLLFLPVRFMRLVPSNLCGIIEVVEFVVVLAERSSFYS